MKKCTRILFAIGLLLSATALSVEAQQKIGHINYDELLQMMPESQQARQEINEYRQSLENDLKEMESELESKYRKFQEGSEMMTELSRQTKMKELQELQGRIQNYQMEANEDLQRKMEEIMDPVYEKADNAIQEVADENGFTYILDSSDSKGAVLAENNGEDILPLVKAKLEIQ